MQTLSHARTPGRSTARAHASVSTVLQATAVRQKLELLRDHLHCSSYCTAAQRDRMPLCSR